VGYYMAIDGAAGGENGDEYEAAQGFPRWYGPDGAEHYMRADSIARSFGPLISYANLFLH
jgi:hypothetical protein